MEIPGKFYMLTEILLLLQMEQVQAAEAEFDLEINSSLNNISTLMCVLWRQL
jgi:hypothetical protein